jgi:hypothetical protein
MEFSKNTKSVLKLDLDALGNWGLATICGIEHFPASLAKNKTSEKGTSASLNLKPASQNRHKSLYRLSAIKSLLHYLLTIILMLTLFAAVHLGFFIKNVQNRAQTWE